MFDNNILMITGGTGSFGNTVLKRFLDTNVKEIRIFSRDEKNRSKYALLSPMTKSNSTSKVDYYTSHNTERLDIQVSRRCY